MHFEILATREYLAIKLFSTSGELRSSNRRWDTHKCISRPIRRRWLTPTCRPAGACGLWGACILYTLGISIALVIRSLDRSLSIPLIAVRGEIGDSMIADGFDRCRFHKKSRPGDRSYRCWVSLRSMGLLSRSLSTRLIPTYGLRCDRCIATIAPQRKDDSAGEILNKITAKLRRYWLMARLKDKIAVITGSGKGLGEAMALLFSREGAR